MIDGARTYAQAQAEGDMSARMARRLATDREVEALAKAQAGRAANLYRITQRRGVKLADKSSRAAVILAGVLK